VNLSRARLLIAALWAGSLWTVGYLVAPVLFARLPDRVLAGTVAGFMFQAEAWFSVVCVLILAGMRFLRQTKEEGWRSELGLIGIMLACTLLGYFALHPWMAALKEAAGPGGIEASPQKNTFAVLHGIAGFFYLVESLLATRLLTLIGKR